MPPINVEHQQRPDIESSKIVSSLTSSKSPLSMGENNSTGTINLTVKNKSGNIVCPWQIERDSTADRVIEKKSSPNIPPNATIFQPVRLEDKNDVPTFCQRKITYATDDKLGLKYDEIQDMCIDD